MFFPAPVDEIDAQMWVGGDICPLHLSNRRQERPEWLLTWLVAGQSEGGPAGTEPPRRYLLAMKPTVRTPPMVPDPGPREQFTLTQVLTLALAFYTAGIATAQFLVDSHALR
jgi:hypothetical protein